MLIPHPLLGLRDAQEFTCLGDAALLARPDPEAPGAEAAFCDYVYLRDNPAGLHRELWFHEQGDRSWLVVTRNTLTHEILRTELARDVPRSGAGARSPGREVTGGAGHAMANGASRDAVDCAVAGGMGRDGADSAVADGAGRDVAEGAVAGGMGGDSGPGLSGEVSGGAARSLSGAPNAGPAGDMPGSPDGDVIRGAVEGRSPGPARGAGGRMAGGASGDVAPEGRS